MNKKKSLVLGLASILTCSLPLQAEEAETTATAATPEAAEEVAEVAASSEPMSIEAKREAHMQARNERYQELRQRAEKSGVMLPEKPPWETSGYGSMQQRPDMQARRKQHEMMMSMSPEERETARMAHYEEMRKQAKERGVDMPETPPWKQRQEMMDDEWKKHQAVIDGMSDEERAACHAMHQRHMGMMRGRTERPMMQGPMGRGMGPGAGQGYGYGPAPYGPGPYAPRNFWDPNQ